MSTKQTLYDLTAEGLEIFDMLADNLGELTTELEQRLDALMLEGPERIEAAAMVVRSLEANVTACEAEAQRLRERAKAFESQLDRLKLRMTKCLDSAFGGKVKTPLFSIWTQKSADRTTADLVPGITAEILHKERPDLVRVKYELDREKCVSEFKAEAAKRNAAAESGQEFQSSLPDLLLFEEKEGSRYVRIR